MTLQVLVVDDDAAIRLALSVLFDVNDIPCITASTPDEALTSLSRHDVGVVIHDMNFTRDTTSGLEGKSLFRMLRKQVPDLPIVLMTAWTDVATAVQLVKEGAHDYIGKPWDDERLVTDIRALLRSRTSSGKERVPGSSASAELAARHDLCGLKYASETMNDVVSLALKVAMSDVPIAITGPNGSGKERIARLIYANSRRRDRPFVTVNTGGLPDELMEAELFGAEPGAFTGAKKLRIGRFEAADGGTLFLDEIGNLSLSGQMKLLRVLQTGEYQRLGSSRTRTADVRILSATNVDLQAAIADGRFREDLFYRLNVVEVRVPRLSERRADIPLLARVFLDEFDESQGASSRRFSERASADMLRHSWPGNVRELQNRVRRALLTTDGAEIDSAALGLPEASSSRPVTQRPPASRKSIRSQRDTAERERIENVLRQSGGVISKAALALGISRQALYRRIDKFGIALGRGDDDR